MKGIDDKHVTNPLFMVYGCFDTYLSRLFENFERHVNGLVMTFWVVQMPTHALEPIPIETKDDH